MKVRARVYFSGQVQGVFFRANTRSHAAMRGVSGWVRNLRDGRVESVMEGEKESVEALIESCREGIPGSRVDDVEITWEKPQGRFRGFEIRTE
jgi:acylphosphatase